MPRHSMTKNVDAIRWGARGRLAVAARDRVKAFCFALTHGRRFQSRNRCNRKVHKYNYNSQVIASAPGEGGLDQ
jgi:hypothetical protein